MKKDYIKPFAEVVEFNPHDAIMDISFDGEPSVGGNVGKPSGDPEDWS